MARQQSALHSEPVEKPAVCTLVRSHRILLISGFDGELIDRKDAVGLRQQGNAHLRTLFFANMVLNGLHMRPAPKVSPFIRLARMSTLVKIRLKHTIILGRFPRTNLSFFSGAPRRYVCFDGVVAFSITRIMDAHQCPSAHIWWWFSCQNETSRKMCRITNILSGVHWREMCCFFVAFSFVTVYIPLLCWRHLPYFSLWQQGRPGASYANDGMGKNNADWVVFHTLEGCLPLVYLRCVPSPSVLHDFVHPHVQHANEADEGCECSKDLVSHFEVCRGHKMQSKTNVQLCFIISNNKHFVIMSLCHYFVIYLAFLRNCFPLALLCHACVFIRLAPQGHEGYQSRRGDLCFVWQHAHCFIRGETVTHLVD